MDVRDCSGWVESLHRHTITFTGKVTIDGVRVNRSECAELARAARAFDVLDDFSGSTTLLVHGDLASQIVADKKLAYSNKLVAVQQTRIHRGPHVHVVDSNGFADLLDGIPTRCRRLRTSGTSVSIRREQGEGVLGGPVKVRKPGTHGTSVLTIDLAGLDAGTAAHEATVAALVEHLKKQGVTACGPARRAPKFDIGWSSGTSVFVGEVKSLTSTNQDQQIRLGLGQVLDYTYQMDAAHTVRRRNKVKPVLILEQAPAHPRWFDLTRSVGVLLTYGPSFPEI